ncbi:hypothetical protein EJ110_NYTH11553 [Nymphaea thermarum]|nr:hypothetical protein EJ110_NYTH11553 [Nymphaea thermarum]
MLLRQFSANQNVSGGIRGNTVAGEGVEPVTPSPSSPRVVALSLKCFSSLEAKIKCFIGHLYEGLEEHGISTFIDSKKLEKEEDIKKQFEYIERSMIFVLRVRKGDIPAFFGVEPSDVRNQNWLFKSALKDNQSNKK